MTSETGSAETPLAPLVADAPAKPPRVWKFWGTLLWGIVIFVAMFCGQIAVVAFFLIKQGNGLDLDTMKGVMGGGLTISLSVVAGLPAVLAAIWLATRVARAKFADYLALRWPGWKALLIGAVMLGVLITCWDLLSKALGREVAPGFMTDVLKSAQADGALWLLVLAFCVGAPVTEEFFVRGFLYRGWSETFLRPVGAIVLSSLVWTLMHLQYDWFFLGEVFSIGLLLGYLRYRYHSTWLTVVVHGINNLAATIQTIWLANQS
ncbi:MAG: CPBP family intramembrane metalloprotease [Afipia sp.]|nr:CPBP family intramembrane metalloprotease [Afipia sp.]